MFIAGKDECDELARTCPRPRQTPAIVAIWSIAHRLTRVWIVGSLDRDGLLDRLSQGEHRQQEQRVDRGLDHRSVREGVPRCRWHDLDSGMLL